MAVQRRFLTERSYYRTLGIRNKASLHEIKAAYYHLAKDFHPDSNPNSNTDEQFARISEAYEFLRDEERRQVYDDLGGDIDFEDLASTPTASGGLLPPHVVTTSINFGHLRQGDSVQSQELVEVYNPNPSALKPQLIPARGAFWEARLSDDGSRISIRTLSMDGRAIGNYYDRLRVGWEESPSSSIELPISLVVEAAYREPAIKKMLRIGARLAEMGLTLMATIGIGGILLLLFYYLPYQMIGIVGLIISHSADVVHWVLAGKTTINSP